MENKKPTAEIKHKLRAVKYANDNIKRISDLLQVIRSRAEKITTSYSDAPGGGHDPGSRAATYDKLVDLEHKQNEAMLQWIQAINDVQVIISWLDDWNERAVLEHKYINCEDWITISFKLNYSIQHIYRLHGQALYKLSIMLKQHERK